MLSKINSHGSDWKTATLMAVLSVGLASADLVDPTDASWEPVTLENAY
jgi:hypothetical protein